MIQPVYCTCCERLVVGYIVRYISYSYKDMCYCSGPTKGREGGAKGHQRRSMEVLLLLSSRVQPRPRVPRRLVEGELLSSSRPATRMNLTLYPCQWRVIPLLTSTTVIIMRNKPRSRSAPPFSACTIGLDWELREDGFEIEHLQMDPADLAEFSIVEIFIDYHPRSMCWVDEDKVLKLFSYLVNVSVIVASMDLARTRLPVPRVLRYGRSGNCSYILMERIPHNNLCTGHVSTGNQIYAMAIDANDRLHMPRNVLVDNNGNISSIIDWDPCTPRHTGGEYARKIRNIRNNAMDVGEEAWYHIFLRYAYDRTGEEIMIDCSRLHARLFLQWPLLQSKASQLVSTPIIDPRNQSFSRQKIFPITLGRVDAVINSIHDAASESPSGVNCGVDCGVKKC
ncbi:hypothetical protein F5879DRAFT_450093 [Lentinula edodes]|nr:hypothetical protein F5879DRAFT_450093 [Lentinula edodes]